ncbi:MAG: TIGR02646 family protein [Methylobacter tundripaludum]|nr:TIGR02646 family protein [Methylobacter tundripaludum]
MRFIDKSSRCKEFDDYVNKNSEFFSIKGGWDLPADVKIILHNHLLKQQKGLCIYCEQQLLEKTGAEYLPESIIEHIRPRTKQKYPELTYICCNLSVACKKSKKKEDKNDDIDFCEDRKADEYDELKFLNPTELPEIEAYFEYDIEGNIFPYRNNERARYMIEVALNLNHKKLNNMRKTQYDIFSEMNIEDVENILLDGNAEQLPAFYSMLKNQFID